MSSGLSGIQMVSTGPNSRDVNAVHLAHVADIYLTWGRENRRCFRIIDHNNTIHAGHSRITVRFEDGTEIQYSLGHLAGEDTGASRHVEHIGLPGMHLPLEVTQELQRRLSGQSSGAGDVNRFVGGTLSGSHSYRAPAPASSPVFVAADSGPTHQEWNTISLAMMHALASGGRIVLVPFRPTHANPASSLWLCEPLPSGECPKTSDGADQVGYRVGSQTMILLERLQQAATAAAVTQAQERAEQARKAARVSVRRPIRRIIGESED